jgi:thiol-disulfide isomerase/thioredoxin
MKMKANVILIALCLLAGACTQQKSYLIRGTAPEQYDGKYVYMMDYGTQLNIDSALIEKGAFTFEGEANTDIYVRLNLGRQLFANVIPEGGVITVELAEESRVGGTPLNDKLNAFRTELDGFYAKFKEMAERLGDDREAIDNVYKSTFPEFIALHDRYVRDNGANAVAAFVFSNYYYELSPEQIDSVYNLMAENIQANEIVQRIKRSADGKRLTAEGMPFADFRIEDGGADGAAVSLSDYVGKGKFVLVDFWASWCGPCIREIPTLREVSAEYGGAHFEVLGVAVWDEREATLKAIETHGTTWPQILNAQSVPTDLYGIDGIPHIILFGPDGKIIARNLRGESLKAKVAEVLQGLE